MEIEYKGGNCILITVKKTTIAVDPKLSDVGLKDYGTQATVQLATQTQFLAPHNPEGLVIDGPGEYEVANISIRGIAARGYLDQPDGPKKATIYSVTAEEIAVAIVGHIHPELSEEQLEALGVIDVLIVPIGGNGYTLDATAAVNLIREVDPKIVVPTHYADKNTTYPVPQAEVDSFIKELGAAHELLNKLKLKSGTIGETLVVEQLQRTA